MPARITLFILVACMLSGCALSKGTSREAVEAKAGELEGLSRSRIVSVVEEPYLGARPIPLPKNAEYSSGIFSKQIILDKQGSIEELCSTISKLTGLPIAVDAPAVTGGSSRSSSHPKGSDLDAQLSAALAGATGDKKPVASSGESRRGIRIAYEGSVKGLLDLLSSRTGLGWEYNPDSGITFSGTTIKTFTLWAAPGKVTFTNKITNQSKEQTGSTSAGGGGVATQDSSLQTAQTHTTELSFDIWKDVETGVKALMSPAGAVSGNQAAGTITVKDSAVVLRKIGKFVDEMNERLSRQVALSIKVWSLEITDSTDVGLNLQMFFENPDIIVSAGTTALKWVAAVMDGQAYRTSIEAAPARQREGEVPTDAFYEQVKRHCVWLGSRMATEPAIDEKNVLRQRKENLTSAKELYVAMQREALGIKEPKRGLGLSV